MLTAQQDNARMQQDLRISEGILSELLNQNRPGHAFSRIGSNLNSVYIPGFGVIFETAPSIMMLELARASTVNIVGADENNQDTRVVVRGTPSAGNSTSDTYNDMKANIQTYFTNYADLISQVKPEETITVMVRPNDTFVYFEAPPPPVAPGTTSGHATASASRTPLGFMMSVKRSDISDHKAGKISENEFKNRIKTKDISRESSTEFKIFEKIMETGLKETDNATFSLNSNLTSIYDDKTGLIILGAIRSSNTGFYLQGLNTMISSIPTLQLDSINIDTDIVIESDFFQFDKENLDSVRVELRRANEELRRAQIEISRSAAEIRRGLDGTIRVRTLDRSEGRTKEQISADFDQFETAIKNLIIDYGRSLASVKSDQSIILNLTVRGTHDGIPSRLFINVPKSTLDAYDNRTISKEAAMAQIKVTRIN